MSVIHKTTMTPTKLELLEAWLPTRPWYVATGAAPRLERAGGFRLDDPAGEVGIEFMVVRDLSGAGASGVRGYLVPMTYRAAPLAGAEAGLVGTSEHGVLGTRHVYDGAHDPVLVDRLAALLQGRAEPQAQRVSHTPDPTVSAVLEGDGDWAAEGSGSVEDGPEGTLVVLGPGAPALRLNRVLGAGDEPAGARGAVTAPWRPAEDEERRDAFVVVLDGR
ncbi:1,4-alpha-glucan branching protein [Streptomyces sp. NPDC048623]|uniref:maltokinase N-terminal cap-like domain-containing protein n=1 Tax=Streptomyces sp. NPDC048623 TaxID=3155761 RepID=UPI0034212D9F